MSQNEERVPTSRGPMTAGQIVDELRYTSYATNRDHGMTSERLAPLFGDLIVEGFEKRYRAEKIESDAATRKVCGVCGEKHAGACSRGFSDRDQAEQLAARGYRDGW